METKPKDQDASTTVHIPTYADRHAKFNRLVDKNPWVKIYVASILSAEAIGWYLFAISKGIDVTELLDRLGLIGIFGAILLVFLPIIILRLREAHDEAKL